MQEIVARPGVVERYIADPASAALIRSTFTGGPDKIMLKMPEHMLGH